MPARLPGVILATATRRAEPTAPAETAPPIPLTPAAVVSFSGKTNKNTTAFAVGSPLRVDYTFRASGNFIVDLNGTDGSTIGSIANRIGKGSATTWVYAGGDKGYFDVTADGPWTLTATAVVPNVSALPITLKGNTDEVTAPFMVSGTVTVRWLYGGSGNFIVDLVDPTDGGSIDSVANLIGKSTDSTQLYGHAGPVALDVVADGSG